MFEKVLLWLRNRVWNIRRRLDKDWAETRRTHFFCGYWSLNELLNAKGTFDEMIAVFEWLIRTTPLCLDDDNICVPELNCVLQYEEKDQLFSAHYYLNHKYQLHIRFFDERKLSKWYSEDNYISVYAHKEIRPDYDPVAHIKGKEITDGCLEWQRIKSMLMS